MRLSGDTEGLSEEGIAEAERAANHLKKQLAGEPLVRIIASPRKRTLETASVIATALDINEEDIEQDERLTERNCEPYLGKLIADTFSKSEEELVAGGMESLDILYTRTKDFYTELVASNLPGNILLVGHSGNLAPLVFATKHARLGDAIDVPILPLDEAIRLY